MSAKYSQIEGLTEFVVKLRDAGEKWNTADGIVAQVNKKFPAYTTDSAIPLRRLYNAAKNEGTVGKGAAKKMVELRDKKMWGWTRIADAAGITVSEAQALYVKGGGELTSGRVYKPGQSHPGAGSAVVKEAKAAAKATDATPTVTEAEVAAAQKLLDAVSPIEDDAPAKPKRRRSRAKKSAAATDAPVSA